MINIGKWNKHEHYRDQAKRAGYRSRAAFKLIEIENRFKILRMACKIVDLCSAPGSWLQVAKEVCIEPNCRIIGVDRAYVKPIPGITIIQSPIEAPDLVSQIRECLDDAADVLLSDCSPKLTGNKILDRERQIWQAQLSFKIALQLLKPNGHFVTKVFQSEAFQKFIENVKGHFRTTNTFKPKSSSKRSPEMYLIARKFQKLKNPVNQDVP